MIYDQYQDHPEFIKDWKVTCHATDGCSSGFLKYVAGWILDQFGTFRKYRPLCIQHDFDYRYGSKYGMTKCIADQDLCDETADLGNFEITRKLFRIIAWFMLKGLQIGGHRNFKFHKEINNV